MSISTFNFQFYNYKFPQAKPVIPASSFSELEMDIDEEEMMGTSPSVSSTPLPQAKPAIATPTPMPTHQLEVLRPQLHKSQKRWSMELREKVLEMSKRNNASDGDLYSTPNGSVQQQQPQEQLDQNDDAPSPLSVSDKINFFNKLTNTFESARSNNNFNAGNNANNNRFISLLRSATAGAGSNQLPPPKPKRLFATSSSDSVPQLFVTPTAKAPTAHTNTNTNNSNNNHNNNTAQRKSSLRRKPSVEKSRATISRQNSTATLRPQRHAIMEDLSLVVPVRLRIAEYEQRISMNA